MVNYFFDPFTVILLEHELLFSICEHLYEMITHWYIQQPFAIDYYHFSCVNSDFIILEFTIFLHENIRWLVMILKISFVEFIRKIKIPDYIYFTWKKACFLDLPIGIPSNLPNLEPNGLVYIDLYEYKALLYLLKLANNWDLSIAFAHMQLRLLQNHII